MSNSSAAPSFVDGELAVLKFEVAVLTIMLTKLSSSVDDIVWATPFFATSQRILRLKSALQYILTMMCVAGAGVGLAAGGKAALQQLLDAENQSLSAERILGLAGATLLISYGAYLFLGWWKERAEARREREDRASEAPRAPDDSSEHSTPTIEVVPTEPPPQSPATIISLPFQAASALFSKIDAVDRSDGIINVEQMAVAVDCVLRKARTRRPSEEGSLPLNETEMRHRAYEIARLADAADGVPDGAIKLPEFAQAIGGAVGALNVQPDEAALIITTAAQELETLFPHSSSHTSDGGSGQGAEGSRTHAQQQQDTRARSTCLSWLRPPKLVVVALFGSFDDLAVLTSLALGGTIPALAILLGVLLGSLIIISICTCASFARPLTRLLERLPLWLIVWAFGIYTAVEALVV